MEETKRITTIELTEEERAAIEEASGRPGYGALKAGILALLEHWRETRDGKQEPQEPEPVGDD